MPIKEKYAFVRPERKKDVTVVVLLLGEPSTIEGLDENGFFSDFCKAKNKTDVFVVTEATFKQFFL